MFMGICIKIIWGKVDGIGEEMSSSRLVFEAVY